MKSRGRCVALCKSNEVPSPSANCNLIAWLLAHFWQKKRQALLYTLSNVQSTLVPFYLDSELLGARYLFVLCLSNTLHNEALGLGLDVFTRCRDAQASSTWAPAGSRDSPATILWCCACVAEKVPGSFLSLTRTVLCHPSATSLLWDPWWWSCAPQMCQLGSPLAQAPLCNDLYPRTESKPSQVACLFGTLGSTMCPFLRNFYA